MTVYINGRFLTQRMSGMQRWAEQMVLALDARLAQSPTPAAFEPVIILHPPGEVRRPPLKRIQMRQVGRRGGHPWEQLDLWAASRDGILVNLLSTGPLLHGRQVSTFHDAAVLRRPDLFSRGYATLHRTLRPLLARRSRALLTVSQFSAGELAECLGVDRGRFAVAPNAADHILTLTSDPSILAKRGLQPGQYGLCVGNQTPNKNVATAIAAFAGLNDPSMKLALVGAGDARVFGDLSLSDHPGVVPMGYVSDEELKALYENARFLCFPSRYEGFGIPVLEAMALGCPVIASDAAAVPETAGDAALLVGPDDVAGFAQAMARVIGDPALAADLQSRGRARAAVFGWDRSAAVLERVLVEMSGGAA